MPEVTIILEDFEAECLSACAIVGIEGCPDATIADAAQEAVDKIKEVVSDAR